MLLSRRRGSHAGGSAGDRTCARAPGDCPGTQAKPSQPAAFGQRAESRKLLTANRSRPDQPGTGATRSTGCIRIRFPPERDSGTWPRQDGEPGPLGPPARGLGLVDVAGREDRVRPDGQVEDIGQAVRGVDPPPPVRLGAAGRPATTFHTVWNRQPAVRYQPGSPRSAALASTATSSSLRRSTRSKATSWSASGSRPSMRPQVARRTDSPGHAGRAGCPHRSAGDHVPHGKHRPGSPRPAALASTATSCRCATTPPPDHPSCPGHAERPRR